VDPTDEAFDAEHPPKTRRREGNVSSRRKPHQDVAGGLLCFIRVSGLNDFDPGVGGGGQWVVIGLRDASEPRGGWGSHLAQASAKRRRVGCTRLAVQQATRWPGLPRA
jgi:hypothetical protein